MFSRCGNGPHFQVLNECGAKKALNWVYNDPATDIKYAGKTFQMPLYFSKLENIRKFLDFISLDSDEMDKVITMFLTLLSASESDISNYDSITLKDWISTYTDNLAVNDFFNCVCILYFALPYYTASAGEFVYSFRNMFLDSSFGYVKGGSGSISRAFVELAEKFGSEIRSNASVKRILVEEGKVTGVELENGEVIQSHLVISNAGLKETVLNLVGEQHFTSEYVSNIKRLKDSLAYLSIKIALKEKVTEKPCVVVMPENSENSFRNIDAGKPPKDKFLFIPIPSNLDPQLAPSGKQLITVGTPCPMDPNTDFQPWISSLKESINEVFPGIIENALWIEVTTPKDIANWLGKTSGCAIGLAQTPDQVGENRFSAISPVEGLYYVGADVKGRGIGTELAADSALKLSSQLIEKLR
jgi:phytoene dehydrogenase-like protein